MAVTAGSCVVSYYGYTPLEGVKLTATATGGSGSYSYSWSTGETTASISVNPSTATTYTVSVTDANGCTATNTVTVQVIDVRCGNKNDKVLVCHGSGKSGKTQELCISPNAVAAHLKHGDQLGGCGQGDPCASGSRMVPVEKPTTLNSGSVNVYPNPASSIVSIELLENIGNYEVMLMDGQGRIILSQAGESLLLDFDVSSVKNGMYFLMVQTQTDLVIKRITIVK